MDETTIITIIITVTDERVLFCKKETGENV